MLATQHRNRQVEHNSQDTYAGSNDRARLELLGEVPQPLLRDQRNVVRRVLVLQLGTCRDRPSGKRRGRPVTRRRVAATRQRRQRMQQE